jgi:hypothetical protein
MPWWDEISGALVHNDLRRCRIRACYFRMNRITPFMTHVWVCLARLVRHPTWGTIGMPILSKGNTRTDS